MAPAVLGTPRDPDHEGTIFMAKPEFSAPAPTTDPAARAGDPFA
jgi:hypothetical protein